MKREWDQAIADCDQAIRLDPRFAQAYATRGNAWREKHELDKAIADLTEAIRLDRHRAYAYSARGCAWSQKKQPDKALTDLDEAIRLDPSDAAAYLNRGIAWGQKHEPDKAIADLSEAIRRHPRVASAYYNRGRAWQTKGRWDQAIADLDAFNRLDPGHGSAYSASAWVRATCPDARYGDGQKAVELARRACELIGWKDPFALGTLAAASAEAGDFDAAIRWQSKANAMVSDPKARTDGEARLKLYQSRTPYREPGP